MKNKIALSLGIWDFNDITHDEITALLATIPSRIYIKGERKNPKFSILSKKNGWLMDIASDKYAPFEQQMDMLFNFIEEKIDIFRILCRKYTCEISCGLFIYFDNGESVPGLHLGSKYNKLVKELNIDFDVDIYCLPNDEPH